MAYDLSKKSRGMPAETVKYPIPVFTQEEIEKQLIGYYQVDIKNISMIRPGTKVKYYEVRGSEVVFNAGGYVRSPDHELKKEDGVRTMLVARHPINNNPWSVRHENIKQLYVKYDIIQYDLITTVRNLTARVSELEKQLTELWKQLSEK